MNPTFSGLPGLQAPGSCVTGPCTPHQVSPTGVLPGRASSQEQSPVVGSLNQYLSAYEFVWFLLDKIHA